MEEAYTAIHELGIGTDLIQWLHGEAIRRKLKYLLAHADDGIVWAYPDAQGWVTAGSNFTGFTSTALDNITLQQARLFGTAGELHLWRTAENSYQWRWIDDPPDMDSQGSQYLLWGTCIDDSVQHFSLMKEGEQGMLHAPPFKVAKGQSIAIKIRHFIEYDDEGQAYIAFSRLVDLDRAPACVKEG